MAINEAKLAIALKPVADLVFKYERDNTYPNYDDVVTNNGSLSFGQLKTLARIYDELVE